jgi:hypothetical protein
MELFNGYYDYLHQLEENTKQMGEMAARSKRNHEALVKLNAKKDSISKEDYYNGIAEIIGAEKIF